MKVIRTWMVKLKSGNYQPYFELDNGKVITANERLDTVVFQETKTRFIDQAPAKPA